MSGEYIIDFTDPLKGSFTINSLETEGPGSVNQIPIVTATAGVGGTFAISGDFTPRFIPAFAFSVIGSLAGNNGAYVTSSSIYQGTTAINAISAVQMKFVLNGVDYTAVFTPNRVFKIINSAPGAGPSNDGYWIVASSAFVAGNTEITVQTGVPSNYRDGADVNDTPPINGSIVTNLTVIIPTVAVPVSITIPDGTIQYTLTGSTSLTLPGRGALNYGENIIEDLVHMLENFYYSIPPVNPTTGQLWFDGSLNNQLMVYDNTLTWVPVGGGGSISEPLNQIVFGTGASVTSDPDFTFDLTTNELKLTGTDPSFTILEHSTAPATPVANQVVLYTKADGFWYMKRDDGIELSVGIPYPQIKNTIDLGETVTILAGFQMIFYQSYQVNGTLINNGTIVVL